MASQTRMVKRRYKQEMGEKDREITFTSWELFNVYSVIGNQTGRAGQMRVWWRILDALEPPNERKPELGWIGVGEANLALNPETFDLEYTVAMSEADYTKMVKAIEDFEGWRAGGVAGGSRDRIKTLFEKLGIET